MAYPPVGFHFRVEVRLDGVAAIDSRFQEVSGLSAEVSVEELVEGGENRFTHRLPQRTKFANLVLKRGLAVGSKLIDWIKDAVENMAIEPVEVLVSLLDEAHEPLQSWVFTAAYPVKWAASDLRAQENGVVIETLELAYQMQRRVS